MGRRVAIISNVLPVVEPLVDVVRDMGHDPVAWLMSRRPDDGRPLPPWGEVTDRNAPQGVNLVIARKKDDVAPLLRGLDLDVTLCWGFNWKLPQEALDVPRLGSVNNHPALLPRHRGPYPIAWAFREGDPVFGSSWHRMDAEFDTGPILAQSSVPIEDTDTWIEDFGPRMLQDRSRCCRRCSSGSRRRSGRPAVGRGRELGGAVRGRLCSCRLVAERARDPQPGSRVAAHVRSFGGRGNVELDGERVKLLRTSLVDPGGDAREVECGDGNIWITESEPVI